MPLLSGVEDSGTYVPPAEGNAGRKCCVWLPSWLYSGILEDTKCTPELYPILGFPPKVAWESKGHPKVQKLKMYSYTSQAHNC